MSDSTLLGNGVVATGTGGTDSHVPRTIPGGAVVWEDDRIVAVGLETELRRDYRHAAYLDAGGGLIMPGLVNLHHHFYSALARGLDPGTPMRDFHEVLDRLWWRLDRALDAETIRVSAELSVVECIRWGCTTVFDHHASPNCLAGSLDIIARTIGRAGLSAVLCYEITDRNGHDQARAGIDENLSFIEAHRDDTRIRGIVGLHASFTLTNETLADVAERRPARVGCHIHAAEDPIDVVESRRAFGSGPIQRLEHFGLLDERCLLAHGIHLHADDYHAIAEHKAVLIHNPESNANNGVGRLDTVGAASHGCLIGLGTDGMSSAVLRALRFAFLIQRAARRDADTGFEVLPDLLFNNARVARRFLDEPLLGELVPEAPADIIVVDAPTPTQLTPDNLFGHLVYGVSDAPIRHTIARGQLLLKDHRHTTLDPEAIAGRAREVAPVLWKRFHALGWGTRFLG